MFVTDTHPLLWFANNKFSKLSAKVLEVVQKAECDESLIYTDSRQDRRIIKYQLSILHYFAGFSAVRKIPAK